MRINILVIIAFVIAAGNLESQFGKNKVQYDVFDWKYIQSAHFDVYYDKGSKDLAEFAAKSSERALASIEGLLKYNLAKRVSFVVYDSHNDFQQTNVIMSYMPEGVGGVTELFKNRVVVPFEGDWAKLDHVIHHELIHAVLNDMFYGGTFQTAVSTGGFAIPLWMNEGLAEFSSLDGMNSETDMFMRDLAISENIPELNQLGGYLAYRGGQTFYWYVAEKYGRERVGDLVNKLKIYKDVDRAFESAFNMDLEDFSEEWKRELKKKYWPDLEVFESPRDFAIQLTDHEDDQSFYNTSPAISPDGEKMAYISAKGGLFAIYVQELDKDAEAKKIVSSNRDQDFEDLNLLTPGISWNPKGDKLSISAKAGGEDAIFIVDVESEDYEKLTWGLKSISSVQWSPDGKKIVFTATESNKSDLFVYEFETKELYNITNDIFSDLNPLWGYRSEKIYYISDRSSYLDFSKTFDNFDIYDHDVYQNDVYELDIKTNNIRRLTFDSEYKKTSLGIGIRNQKLLYVSDKNGISNIYELDTETLASRPVTNSINAITQISVSPDASKLLFATQINGGYDIYMMRYPFDVDLEIDELPLTKFRKAEMEEKVVAENVKARAEKEIINSEEEELISYGDFEVDVSRQELVEPNEDAAQSAQEDDAKLESNERSQAFVDDDGEFIEKDYKVNFSTDIIAGNPGFSTFWGAQGVTQMVFSDELGDHQILVQANLVTDLRNSQIYFAYNYLPNLIDYQFRGYNTNAYLGFSDVNNLDPDRGSVFYNFRNLGLGVFGSYAFDRFKRLEFGMDMMYLVKQPVFHQEENDDIFIPVPSVKYTYDNTLWGFYGPRDGARYFMEARGTPKYSDRSIGFLTLQSDARYYIPLGRFFNFAFRGIVGASFGPDPQNFFIGGTDNWINREFSNDQLPFENPEDFAFLNFVMPLRGWAVADGIGDKFFVGNAEFRFPLVAYFGGPIPLLQYMMGAFFYDIGGAWSDEFIARVENMEGDVVPQDLLMSTGVGVRSIVFGLPLKLDVAWRNMYSGWSEPYYMISLGLDF